MNNLGFACQAEGKYKEASEIFERVIGLSGSGGVAYNNLAGVVYRQGLVDSAETLWEKAIKLDPENQQFKKNLDFIREAKNK